MYLTLAIQCLASSCLPRGQTDTGYPRASGIPKQALTMLKKTKFNQINLKI